MAAVTIQWKIWVNIFNLTDDTKKIELMALAKFFYQISYKTQELD